VAVTVSRAEGVLFGRGRDLAELTRTVRRDALVTVWGPPGVGKTRLARELARRWHDEVWWCDLTQARDAAGMTAALARTLGVTTGAEPRALARFLARRGGALVVLDNYEHLVAVGREALSALREGAPALRVVVTSREPLSCDDETVVELQPLALPPQAADQILRCASVKLLLARAGLSGADGLDPAELARVVRSLDGLPLAIELAAARMRVTGLAGLTALLPRKLDALASRRLSARHRTMRAALTWSWQLLTPAQARALACCSVFAGSFDAAAAESVIGTGALRCLEELLERQLVRSDRPGRLSLFEVVRELASEQLDAMGAREEAEARHREHYLGRQAVLEDLDNLLAVADRSSSLEHAVEAILAVGPLLVPRGLVALYRARLERFDVPLAESSVPPALRRRFLHALGHARGLTGDYERALADLEAAQVGAEGSLAAAIHKDRGWVHHAARRLDDARTSYEQALALLDDARSSARLRAVLVGNLAAIDHDLGLFESAGAGYRRALTAFRRLGDARHEGIFTTNLGVLDAERGAAGAARSRYRRALRLLGDSGDARLQAITLGNLALLEHGEGDLAAARVHHERALGLLDRVGEPRSEALCRARLGAVLAALGEIADAEVQIEAAAELVREGDALGSAIVQLSSAFLDVAAGRPQAALARIDQARAPDGKPLGEVSDDARALLRILMRSLSDELAPALEVGDGWFRAPGGRAHDVRAHAATRRVFGALVAQREERPGQPMDVDALFAAGWPEEHIAAESAANRVYVTLARLRKMGLKAWLLHDRDGYLIDPTLRIERTRRRRPVASNDA
jgi:predicted ATPase/Tfp pilus assembly protein PilF